MPASTAKMPKKLLFATEWLKDRNATKAAKRAGYSERTAHDTGSRLLKDPEVQKFIDEHSEKIVERAEVDAARVLKEIHLAAFLDPSEMFAPDGTLLPIDKMPEHARRAIAGLEVVETFEWEGEGKNRHRVWSGYIKKVKLVSKEGTLTLAARHLGMLHDNLTLKSDLPSALEKATKRVTNAQRRRE